jgi:hypothetical protein
MDIKLFLQAAAKQIVSKKLLAPILILTEAPSFDFLRGVHAGKWYHEANERILLESLNGLGDDGKREIALAGVHEIRQLYLWDYLTIILMESPPEKVQFDIVRGWGGRTKLIPSKSNPLQLLFKAGVSKKQIIIIDNSLKTFINSKI